MDGPWQPLTIDQVRERFAGHTVDWWIAGGWAIDLFLGWQSRSHDDIDVEMFKVDRNVLFEVFDGWELFFVSERSLHGWDRDAEMRSDAFGVWGRPDAASPWAVEIMLADGDDEMWLFRRDNEITFPRDELTLTGTDGVRFCRPEVQLLFKSKKHRSKDDQDMVRCLHRMDRAQRRWLDAALARTEPDHPWRDLLRHAAVEDDE